MTDDRGLVWRFAVLAAAIFWGHGVVVSASQAMFLQVYGAAALPLVWVAIGLTCFWAVGAMSWALRRAPVATVLKQTAVGSALIFYLLLSGHALGIPGAMYALFVFKDVYIVLLSELFWVLANGEFAQLRAVKIYGLFCAAGSLGGALGNLAAGPWATAAHISNDTMLYATVPLCLLVAGAAGGCERRLRGDVWRPAPTAGKATSWSALGEAVGVVRRSRMLPLMLGLVLTAQICITVVDFQFNDSLASHYANLDDRRRLIGTLGAAINALSLVLQLGTGLVVRLLGQAGTLRSIPLGLLACMAVHGIVPGFASISLVRVVSKSNDYSLFRAVKEFLYIPLSYKERTLGKAMIDMLAYRLAKAPAAALIWLVTACCSKAALGLVGMGLCLLWLGITQAILRRRTAAECEETDKVLP